MNSFPPRSSIRLPAICGLLLLSLLSWLALAPLRAGDILRGGAPLGSSAARSATNNQAINAAAAQARSNARDSLARTSRALQEARNLQASARAVARAQTTNNLGLNPNNPGVLLPNVPNGLAVGGLDRDTSGAAIWTGADLPQQSTSGSATNVRIKQTQQTALLSWNTFNVGRKTTLQFDQKAGGADVKKWVAFNKINDPSGAPSQILGSIKADGQVYVINRNGIIFGGASQVNTASLVASSLPINDNLIERGLLNNPDAQFLFSGLAIPAGSRGTPAFNPEAPTTLSGRYGDIAVQRGAQITAPSDAAKAGGRVMLVGPNVRNEGTISTPDGQTILAAGLQVGIDAHSTADPSLRGLDVFVGAIAPTAGAAYAGTVSQEGLVEAIRGNITLAGSRIRQDGVLESSTSVALNGRIDLQAYYDSIPNSAYDSTNPGSGRPFLFQQSGSVTLGRGSSIRIRPETESSETVPGLSLALQSQITATGKTVYLAPNSMVQAKGGIINLNAGIWNFRPGVTPIATFIRSGGQVYFDRNSFVDASGTVGASAPVSNHVVDLELRGAELAPSPLQRDGLLRGVPITVDLRHSGIYNGFAWIGTPLGDATGFAALVQRTVGEYTAPGGRVNISAGESVVMQPGSEVDVSGGYINYQGGLVKTTRVLSGSNLFAIKDATPDRVYDRIYDGMSFDRSERWGVERSFAQPLALTGAHLEPDYLQGAAGGSINITAPSMALDGTLTGRTIDGPRQLNSPTSSAALNLSFLAQDQTYTQFPSFNRNPPAITVSSAKLPGVGSFALDAQGNPAPLPSSRIASVALSPSLLDPEEAGFGYLAVDNPEGSISVPKSVSITTRPAGGIALSAANVDVLGDLHAPGGYLVLQATNVPLDTLNLLQTVPGPSTPAPSAGRGNVNLAPGATLSTTGQVLDRRIQSPFYEAGVIRGGNVQITSYNATLSAGSRIDVSGGAEVASSGLVTFGDAGSISISTGADLNIGSVLGGRLRLGTEFRGYSGARGGDLSLTASAFQIGGANRNSQVLVFQPDFFDQGGFGHFSLTGIGLPGSTPDTYTPGLSIVSGTTISPVSTGWIASVNTLPQGGVTFRPTVRPEGLRTPVSLTFNSVGAVDAFSGDLLIRGDTIVGREVSIETDALANINISGDTVAFFGSVTAPGGTISLAGAGSLPSLQAAPPDPLPTVYLSPEARLSTAGTSVTRPGIRGRTDGFVSNGGTISLSGNVVAERGSVLNVSGTSGTLDLPTTYASVNLSPQLGFRGLEYSSVTVETDAGSISLQGSEMLYVDSTLLARRGGPSATGGSLSVSSDRFRLAGTGFNTAEQNLEVTQTGYSIPRSSFPRGVGRLLRDASGVALPGIGRFSVDRLAGGGFDSLTLGGNPGFASDVRIRMPGRLSVGTGGVIYGSGDIHLAAPYVALGQAFEPPALNIDLDIDFTQTDAGGITTPFTLAPTFGNGRLVVQADTIDVGDLVLQGIGSARLSAKQGDIRGNGVFSMAGDLTLEAGQIYPTTLSPFNIFVYDFSSGGTPQSGQVTVRGGGTRPLPLSAGGSLAIYASRIEQGGSLRAPFGTITLGWDGSGIAPVNSLSGSTLSVPVTEQVTLGSNSSTSVSGLGPGATTGLVVPFGISFDGNSWIDPAGNDITVGGLPTKQIRISGETITALEGSTIDVRGGGDLFSYRWIQGNGGPDDILASSSSFAIIPGYDFDYAPFGAFNTSSQATNLQGELGYRNDLLKPGDRLELGGSDDLVDGTFTLLPARYALLPGAFLITPLTPGPVGEVDLADGSSIASGYRFNALDHQRRGRTQVQRFEVAPGSVVRERAEYVELFANTFLSDAAKTRDLAVPRLPFDAGLVSFGATTSMQLGGNLLGTASKSGRGSLVDISTPAAILINSSGSGGGPGVLTLSASSLNRMNAESLLIGGRRATQGGSTIVETVTSSVTLDNAGSELTGTDLILVAKQGVTLAAGSQLRATGTSAVTGLTLGSTDTPGSGDGVAVRVSGAVGATVTRFGVSTSTTPLLTIGTGARIEGGSVILGSTARTSSSALADISGSQVELSSGQISIQLTSPGSLNPTTGLVLSGNTLLSLQRSARSLSLLSFSSIDIYGRGTIGSPDLSELSLQSSAIRGFNTGTGQVTLSADRIALGNSSNTETTPLSTSPLAGTLQFDANEIRLGDNALRVERYAQVNLNAQQKLLIAGSGRFSSTGAITATSPLVTGIGAASGEIQANGALRLLGGLGAANQSISTLGADLRLSGSSVDVDTTVRFPSGSISITASAGDVRVGQSGQALLDVAGVTTNILDVTRSSSGGVVSIASATGSILLQPAGSIKVSSPGGDGGTVSLSAPNGTATLSGQLEGSGGSGRRGGSFLIDFSTIAGGNLATSDSLLNTSGFTHLRDYRIRSGDLAITGSAQSSTYRVAVDSGALHVSGAIDASGTTGGVIELSANRGLTLAPTARLDASGDQFDAAGQGGSVVLSSGTSRNGIVSSSALLDLQAGSEIDLSVAASSPGSASRGDFTGTLHLRAPQIPAGYSDIQMASIGSDISGASAILVEGYRLYDASSTSSLSTALRDSIRTDANAFLGSAGIASANYTAMMSRLTSLQPGLDLILAPGAEIISSANLTLGTSSSAATNDWNLSTFRFGPRSAPGVLTLRSSGNIQLNNAISDGFGGGSSLWLSPLLANNPNLPDNTESWSYHFTAGADLSASSYRATSSTVSSSSGFLQLGKNMGGATATGGNNALTSSIIGNNFNVIRTGSGNIDITTARSVQLLNPFASIYTAGTQVASPTTVVAANDFVVPNLIGSLAQESLGSVQQAYPAQYSLGGGNVTITAGENLERKTRNNSGLIDDSSRQLPVNWLNRRGYVGDDGSFGSVTIGTGFNQFTDPSASTSWWVDFSNFFQTSGALGGGHVTLTAGHDVVNFDAAIPTNARAAQGVPSPNSFLELGGGDLEVTAGNDLNAGVYYVERGNGRLKAGGEIRTNSTRSPSLGILQSLNSPDTARFDSNTWMPTTLFLGKSSFDVSAAEDILLGPASNPFLLPPGLNNRFWYKSYFSTFAEDSAVRVTSLGGDVTLRNAVTLPNRSAPVDILRIWLETQNLLTTGSIGAAFSQPWLRLGETSVEPFSSLVTVRPPIMQVDALNGDISLTGTTTLFPSPQGQLELISGGAIQGLQPTGISTIRVAGQSVQVWSAATINVSDTDPDAIPAALSPLGYFGIVGNGIGANNTTRQSFLSDLTSRLTDSGSITGSFGVAQTKLALHDSSILHANSAEPLRIYASQGDISGLTLFSPKQARIFASQDISDVAFYLQNVQESDLTVVSAGRDIRPFDASTSLRNAALSSGNALGFGQLPLAGDIHLGGPGTLQILAGRDVDLGTGAPYADGTGSGIVTLGNIRNLSLPFAGADLVIGAGVGTATSLADSALDVQRFIAEFIDTGKGSSYLDELGISDFATLNDEDKAQVALDVFYLILRDTGRDFNDPSSPGYQSYTQGFAAIESLFGQSTAAGGEISARSRNIRTRTGGDISLFAPEGGLSLANAIIGDPSVPPGIVTETGGRVSIFTNDSVDIGVGRIFTLRGGDMMIWSSAGDIAAGTASKTVASAPPTRVIFDPQSAAVETDLAGLSTGGGIGVLATVAGVAPGNVDLIAPAGVIDAGDAGIRVTGNINLAATQVLNASNIAVGGSSAGAPAAPTVAAPSLGGLGASNAAAAANSSATTNASEAARQQTAQAASTEAVPSIFTVEVLGYGGGGAPEEDDEEEEGR